MAGLRESDHVCWAYRAEREFVEAAIDWVADGLRIGQRVVYIADRSIDTMVRDLAPLGALVSDARARGALVLQRLSDLYPGGGPVDPGGQLESWDAATREATADGYRGMRALAEVTALVRDPAWVTEHARWEQLADAYMASNPLSALCAYDRSVVDISVLEPIACVHPVRHATRPRVSFSLFAGNDGLCLDGDVDTFQSDLLNDVLSRRVDQDGLALHVAPGAFLDVGAVTVIARHAKEVLEGGGSVRLTNESASVGRLWDLLRFDRMAPLQSFPS